MENQIYAEHSADGWENLVYVKQYWILTVDENNRVVQSSEKHYSSLEPAQNVANAMNESKFGQGKNRYVVSYTLALHVIV